MSRTTLLVPGRELHGVQGTHDYSSDIHGPVRPSREIVVESGHRGVRDQHVELRDLSDDDVLELEWEGGLTQWVSVGQLRADETSVTRGNLVTPHTQGVLRLGATRPAGGTSRGLSDWLLRGVRLLGFLTKPAAELAAQKFGKIDDHLVSEPGLRWCVEPTDGNLHGYDAADHDVERPHLLLLHGTFSSTTRSFDGLVENGAWQRIRQVYDRHIVCLEHHTLTASPLANIIHLLEQLPKGAQLDVLSQSRGGLLGDLLALPVSDNFAPDQDADIQFLEAVLDGADAGTINKLDEIRRLKSLLAAKRPQVRRFVRVAAPVRGTPLAGDRLDLYLSAIFNLATFALGGGPIANVIKDLALEVVRTRTNPALLPGLEAMMPSGSTVALLNRGRNDKAADDLLVVAGDAVGDGIFKRLGVWLSDLFFLEDHDLVVPTDSMTGGVPRNRHPHVFFEGDNPAADDVHHFNYFRRNSSQDAIVGWLSEGRLEGRYVTQRSGRSVPTDVPALMRSRSARDTVILLPGIMGSHLREDGDRIWLQLWRLAWGGLSRLQIDEPKVQPDGLIGLAYADLAKFLARTHNVRAVAYDWRKSIATAADQLAEEVGQELGGTGRVHVLAHSMGGLVARSMFKRHPTIWEEIVESQGRFVMLGTPNSGSYIIPRLLLGDEPILRWLAAFDQKNKTHEIQNIVRRYPGVLEMLPRIVGDQDFFDLGWWQTDDDRLQKPAKAQVQVAKKVRDEIEQGPIDPHRMIYVAGLADETPDRLTWDTRTGKPVFETTVEGDGRVSWVSGRLDGVPTWYMNAAHGDMADHDESFVAIRDLLDHGTTDDSGLVSHPPFAARSRSPVVRAPRTDRQHLYPTEDELADVLLGRSTRQPSRVSGRTRRTEALPSTQLQVSLVAGDLAGARYPVLVGHYKGDGIFHAERALDGRLGGKLSELHRIGRYPQHPECPRVVLDRSCQPPGALVIGLGQVGELTAERLQDAVTAAVLDLANEARDDGNATSLGVSALLVGTNSSRGLTVAQSVRHIVQGVLLANRHLVEIEGLATVASLEFVELYENMAEEVARALARLKESLTIILRSGESLAIEPRVQLIPGSLPAKPNTEEEQGWWRQVRIELEENGQDIRWDVLTQRARVERYDSTVQRPVVDSLINAAIDGTGSGRRDHDIAATLFELLVPRRLKSHMGDGLDITLLLDDDVADIPWELLRDGTSRREEPLGTRMAIIRQLAGSDFRADVVAPAGTRALVIGNPSHAQPGLPGAESEARSVAQALERQGWTVVRAIREDPATTMTRFFEGGGAYQIVHIAAHGDLPTADQGAGVILSDDVRLTAAEFSRLRTVPPFVFINCCHTGKIEVEARAISRPYKFAASLAKELVNMGVRGVVVAGWPVDDAAAKVFAESMYGALLSAIPFGPAVQLARRAAYCAAPHSNTWGAYQCYGDPHFALASPKTDSWRQPNRRVLSRRELGVELLRLEQACRGARTREIATVLAELGELMGSVPYVWQDANCRLDQARILTRLGHFEEALEAFALAGDVANERLELVDERAIIEAHRACQLRHDDAKQAKRLIKSAFERIMAVRQIADSNRRQRLSASIVKRFAWLDDETRSEKLERAEELYATLLEVGSEAYRRHNVLMTKLLRGESPPQPPKPQEGPVPRAADGDPDVWELASRADGLLLHAMTGPLEEFAEHEQALIDAYSAIEAGRPMPWDRITIATQIELTLELLRDTLDPQQARILGKLVAMVLAPIVETSADDEDHDGDDGGDAGGGGGPPPDGGIPHSYEALLALPDRHRPKSYFRRYVLTLEDDADVARISAAVRDVLASLGASWQTNVVPALRALAVEPRDSESVDRGAAFDHADALEAIDGVAAVDVDVTVDMSPVYERHTPRGRERGPGWDDRYWHLEFIRLPPRGSGHPSPKGEGILVGHPDTGYLPHPEIYVKDRPVYTCIDPSLGYDFESFDDNPRDDKPPALLGWWPGYFYGHGTATCSVLASRVAGPHGHKITGVAPKATVVPLRVADSVIHITWGNLRRALRHARDKGLHVISMSLGGPTPDAELHRELMACIDAGIVVVCAAGQFYPWKMWPGEYAEVLTVGACDHLGRYWEDASDGPHVEVTAPGVGVWRANVAKNGDYTEAPSYGTSYATAMVAGVAALWLETHGVTRLRQRYGKALVHYAFKHIAKNTTFQPPGFNWHNHRWGAGVIDASAILNADLPSKSVIRDYKNEERSRERTTRGVGDERVSAAANVVAEFTSTSVEHVEAMLGDSVASDPKALYELVDRPEQRSDLKALFIRKP